MNKQPLRCSHRHTSQTHPQCFQDGKLIDDAQWWRHIKTGYIDIESTGFKGDFNFMLSWSIYDPKNNHTYYDYITQKDLLTGTFDKRILKSLLNKLSEYDCIVTYYGTKFDVKMIRTRAFSNGLQFPNFGQIKHIDLYYTVKSKLLLSRNSLDSACRLFGIEGKNHLNLNIWIRASIGHKKSIDYVVDHNKRDVKILYELHEKLASQAKFTKRSI